MVILLVAVIWLFSGGRSNPLTIGVGADGRGSTSKLQAAAWTVAIFFGFVTLYAASLILDVTVDITMPRNLLLALGFSAVTVTAAKGITSTYVAGGRINKDTITTTNTNTNTAPATGSNPGTPLTQPKLRPKAGPFSGYVLDDDGNLDLFKIQVLAWTAMSIVTFIINLYAQLNHAAARVDPQNNLKLPDIDETLMVLMGLGSGAYLGNKLVQAERPRLTGISPSADKPGNMITLYGAFLGDSQSGSQIIADETPINPKPVKESEWKDDHVTFELPLTLPDGSPWSKQVAFSLIVNGDRVLPPLPFAVTPIPGRRDITRSRGAGIAETIREIAAEMTSAPNGPSDVGSDL